MTQVNPSASLFILFLELTIERLDPLTALDTASGDGDFGQNLRFGLSAVQDDTMNSCRSGFSSAAKVFLDDVGGTSGPLFGLLFQELAIAEEQADSLADTFCQGLAPGLAAIQRVGGAAPGDRTLVDALYPAVQAISSSGSLSEAASAATEGARRTANLVARRGRASYVGQRAIGTADPGAVGVALFLNSAAEATGADQTIRDQIDLLLPSFVN